MSRVKAVFLYLLAIFMTGAGIMHFIKPAFYAAMIPPYLPAPLYLVYASGVAEIVVGIGLFIPRLRRLAAWGVIATLLAVFPANIHHAVSGGITHPDLPESMADPIAAWVRLPFQFVFIAWAYWFTRPESTPESTPG